MGIDRSGRAHLHPSRGSIRNRGGHQHICCLPPHGPHVRRRCGVRRFWRYLPGLDTHGYGQYVCGDAAVRRLPPCLRHRAPGVRVFHRPGQRIADPLLPRQILAAGLPSGRSEAGINPKNQFVWGIITLDVFEFIRRFLPA